MASPGVSLTGSFDHGVSWFSRLLTDQRITAALGRNLKAERGLAITFIQGAGVAWSPSRMVTYSRPSLSNPPMPLKNSRSRGAGDGGDTGAALEAVPTVAEYGRRRAGRADRPNAHGGRAPRHARPTEAGLAHRRQQVSTKQIHRPWAGLISESCAVGCCAPDVLDRDLKILHVGGVMLVDDYEVYCRAVSCRQ